MLGCEEAAGRHCEDASARRRAGGDTTPRPAKRRPRRMEAVLAQRGVRSACARGGAPHREPWREEVCALLVKETQGARHCASNARQPATAFSNKCPARPPLPTSLASGPPYPRLQRGVWLSAPFGAPSAWGAQGGRGVALTPGGGGLGDLITTSGRARCWRTASGDARSAERYELSPFPLHPRPRPRHGLENSRRALPHLTR